MPTCTSSAAMGYRLKLEKSFSNKYAKLSKPERSLVDSKLRILALDPWHPSLRLKKIRGTSEYEVSVNMDIRIALCFEEDCLILLLDVDHHDRSLKRRTRK